MRLPSKLRLGLGALLLLALALPGGAATYYVAVDGDDAAAGTEGAPFQTLAKGGAVAQPGDTVLLKAGDYPVGSSLRARGAEGQPVTVRPAGDGPVRFLGRVEVAQGFRRAEGTEKTYVAEVTGQVAAVAVDWGRTRLVIEGLQPVKSVEEVEAGVGRWFHDPEAGRLYVNYQGTAFEPEHTIHVLRDSQGLHVSGSWLVVEGLTLAGFAANGVTVEGAEQVTLRDLRVSQCGYAWGAAMNLYQNNRVTVQDCVLFRSQNALMLNACRGVALQHCTLYRTRAHGILADKTEELSLRNSIIYAGGRSGSALYLGREAEQDYEADYNCWLDTGTSALVTWTPREAKYSTFWDYQAAVRPQEAHSLSEEPLFVSTELGAEDFRLREESPCRGRAEDGGDLGARGRARQE